MSDDSTNGKREKEHLTGISGVGKEFVRQLTPGHIGRLLAGRRDEKNGSIGMSLDRRTYLQVAGSATTAGVVGTLGARNGSASVVEVDQPQVSGYGGASPASIGGTASLLLDAANAGPNDADEHASATPIEPGTPVSATLDPESADWYTFTASAGEPIVVEFDRTGAFGVTAVVLYGPDEGYKELIFVTSDSPQTLDASASSDGDYLIQVADVKDGDGPYEMLVELDSTPSVAVRTGSATQVDEESAVLHGELTELRYVDDAEVGFEYGESGGDLDNSVTVATLPSTSQFFESVDGLDPDTEYEFRAVAESGSVSDTGGRSSFTTDADDDSGQKPFGGSPRPVPGRIQAEDFDEGGESVAYHDASNWNFGGEYRPGESVDVERSGDTTDDYSVGYVYPGEWLEYTVDVTPGTYELSMRVATPWHDREIEVSLDGETLGTLEVSDTGGRESWETVTLDGVDVSTDGEAILRLEFVDGGVNLNWLEFAGQQPYLGTPGSIPGRVQAEEFDEGGEGTAYHDTTDGNLGGEFRPEASVDIERSGDTTNDYSVGYTEAGEWLEYTVDATSGTYELGARVAADGGGRELLVELDGESLGTIQVPDTGGTDSWETVTLDDISVPTDGQSILRVEVLDSGLNLNWIEFSRSDDDSDYGEQGYGHGGYGGITAD
jgi:hypothetical protein